MAIQAIALCRVSTAEQKLNSSLNRQEENVLKAANKLDAKIVRWWSGDVSSKAGTNLKRKDLKEMLAYCKSNRGIKYLIVDEPDRFMRSIDEAFYFEVAFRQLGVMLWYASDDNLNTGDLMAKMLKFAKYFPAEGSNVERQTKSINGHKKAIQDGRYTFPPKPGYMKGTQPGVHVRKPGVFEPLQQAFKEVASGLYTPCEALDRLNESSFTKHHSAWRMDKFKQFAIDPYYAGQLEMSKQVQAENKRGLHEAMLTMPEHLAIVETLEGTTKRRGAKKQYNPEFPMNKLLLCADCRLEAKFTGSKKSNGVQRNVTKYYWKYNCRGCGRSFHRDEVHTAITERLGQLSYKNHQRKEFIVALASVWEQKQKDKLQYAANLQRQREKLNADKSAMIQELVRADDDLKEDIRIEIVNIKAAIADTESKQHAASDLEQDLVDFMKFALEYTNILKDDWWELDHENRVRCQQLLLPGGISFSSKKKVGTPEISPLYRLKPNKKDLSFNEKSLMVELPGTAPGSVSVYS